MQGRPGQLVAHVVKFMKPERAFENPEPLRQLMREWSVITPLSPRFQEGVWHRIERVESNAAPEAMTTLWSVIKVRLMAALPRPAVAVTYLTVLFVAGMAVGYWQAQNQTAHLEKDLGMRYLQSVDPYQKPPRS